MSSASEEAPTSILYHGQTAPSDASSIATVLEQYKLFVASSEALVARRQNVNAFFLSLNTVILGGIGLFVKEGVGSWSSAAAMLVLGFAGAVLSFLWHRLIQSYQQLNAGKFRIIEQLETVLPASVFRAEWSELGEGKNPDLYRSSTGTEKAIARVFLAMCVLIALAGCGLGIALIRRTIGYG